MSSGNFDKAIADRLIKNMELGRTMCNCSNVHFYEIEFKLFGMKVVPSHKNCGDTLSDEQFSKFEKELIKYWGFEERK